MILEESPSESPDTGKDEVKFIKFPWRLSRSVVLCQQTVQQGAEHLTQQNTSMLYQIKQSFIKVEQSGGLSPDLHHAGLWDGSDGLQVAADLLQAVRHVLFKQNREIRSL